MSNVTQIYSIVNAAVADFMGSYNVRAKDTTSFVDLGRSLGDLTTEADPYHGYDAFFGALVSRNRFATRWCPFLLLTVENLSSIRIVRMINIRI